MHKENERYAINVFAIISMLVISLVVGVFWPVGGIMLSGMTAMLFMFVFMVRR
jgi:hypothetical protein